ncbi:MAG: DNA translocase FtsK [Clostridia bacterium]|nr:DNA translocase FtsK [Clostridia bacterium]
MQEIILEGKIAPIKADKKSNISIDDLKIQPEAYELPDEDEAPFDISGEKPKASVSVKAGFAGKADNAAKVMEFPKLKRAKDTQAVEDVPEYNYPPIDLLARGEVEDTTSHGQRDIQKAQLLEETLQSFGISAKLVGIAHGPSVTRFELQLAPGVKVSQITALVNDIALHIAATSVRIEAPIPGKTVVGVEISNDKVEMVCLREVLESSEAQRHPSRIAVGLGKDNSGRSIVADIAKMPHMMIAGQLGSDISVCINSIIASILFRASPEEVKLILIDSKKAELSMYNNIPHLVCPVVTDSKKAIGALNWVVAEATKRNKLFMECGVHDIKDYNKKLKHGEKPMSQIVFVIKELADIMVDSDDDVEDKIYRLTAVAHYCGIHLVIATQCIIVNVVTNIIKANIPTRIAFSMASQQDSRMIIDQCGAEKLLGNGDMLFVPNGMKSMRVQGAWVSDDEVHAIVEYIKQSGEAVYDPDMLEHLENANRSDAEKEEFEAEYDPKLPEAVDIALDMGQVSISMLQRKMRIGYARAGRIIDEMARRGIVSEADGSKPRVVLITREQAQQMFEE